MRKKKKKNLRKNFNFNSIQIYSYIIVGSVVGVLCIICLVGGIAYSIGKSKSEQASSSSSPSTTAANIASAETPTYASPNMHYGQLELANNGTMSSIGTYTTGGDLRESSTPSIGVYQPAPSQSANDGYVALDGSVW